MQFTSTAQYVATGDLAVAINAAIAPERPLLVKRKPGTGKTELARQAAVSLRIPLLEWTIKSTTKAIRRYYEYDAVSRLRNSQLGDARINNIRNHIKSGRLWEAFTAKGRQVPPIDDVRYYKNEQDVHMFERVAFITRGRQA